MTEASIQSACLAALRKAGASYAEAWKDGRRRGCPDLMVIHAGRLLGIQVKQHGRDLEEPQKAEARRLLAAGGGYAVVSDARQAVAAYLSWSGRPFVAGAGIEYLCPRLEVLPAPSKPSGWRLKWRKEGKQ